MDIVKKTVKCVYGDTHVIAQSDFDNKKKIRIRLIETSNPNVVLNAAEGSKLGSIHRENIILDDTVGFQVVSDKGDFWEHKANEVIKLPDDAALKLVSAIHRQPNAGWKSVQIAKDSIENISFI